MITKLSISDYKIILQISGDGGARGCVQHRKGELGWQLEWQLQIQQLLALKQLPAVHGAGSTARGVEYRSVKGKLIYIYHLIGLCIVVKNTT